MDPFNVTNAGELATPALVAIVAILLFIAILAFRSKKQKPHRPALHEVSDLGNHGERVIESTVFVVEDGQVVRRSTRPRKPLGGETPVKAAAEETAPKTPRASSKAPKTPVKTPPPAKETTPVVEEREMASPPRTRSRRTPRA